MLANGLNRQTGLQHEANGSDIIIACRIGHLLGI